MSSRVILAISGSALLAQFSEVAVFSGSAINSVPSFAPGVVPIAWTLLGQLFFYGGIVFAAGSIASITAAAMWAFTLPGRAVKGVRANPDPPAHPVVGARS